MVQTNKDQQGLHSSESQHEWVLMTVAQMPLPHKARPTPKPPRSSNYPQQREERNLEIAEY